MAERSRAEQEVAKGEVDSLTGGPGIVATKSQAKESLVGIVIGLVVGAILGAIVGAIADVLVVGIIVGAVGGAVVAGVAGGGQSPRHNLEGSEADH